MEVTGAVMQAGDHADGRVQLLTMTRRLTTTEVVSQAASPLQDVMYSLADTGHMAIFWGPLR